MRTVLVGLVMVLTIAGCSSSDEPQITTADLANADDVVVTFSTATAVPATAVPEPTAAEPTETAPTEVAADEPASTETETDTAAVGDGLFPTVVGATASTSDGSSWRFDVTLLSEYDSPARYADAWRVLDADDNELGIRVLGHDHANEQPFTRSTSVDVPGDITTVFVEGRDQVNGWSGERFEVTLDR